MLREKSLVRIQVRAVHVQDIKNFTVCCIQNIFPFLTHHDLFRVMGLTRCFRWPKRFSTNGRKIWPRSPVRQLLQRSSRHSGRQCWPSTHPKKNQPLARVKRRTTLLLRRKRSPVNTLSKAATLSMASSGSAWQDFSRPLTKFWAWDPKAHEGRLILQGLKGGLSLTSTWRFTPRIWWLWWRAWPQDQSLQRFLSTYKIWSPTLWPFRRVVNCWPSVWWTSGVEPTRRQSGFWRSCASIEWPGI